MSRHRRPQGFNRTDRIADQIQRELSQLLQFQLKDPRVGLVTVQDVKVSRDLSYADVYFTLLGEDHSAAEAAEQVLTHAAGFLRSRLAQVLNTRTTPRLRFHYDATPERAAELSQLINQARDQDRKLLGDDGEPSGDDEPGADNR